MSPAGRRRRALKLQARQLFFRYRRPCLLAALLVVCLSLLAQTFSAVAGGALYYDFLDVRQLPLGTGLWLADAGLMGELLSTMGLPAAQGAWGGLIFTLRYQPLGVVLVLPLAWRQLLDFLVVQAVVLAVTAPLECGALAQLRRTMDGRPQRLPHLFRWYADPRLTLRSVGLQLLLGAWKGLTALVCAAPGLACLILGAALPEREELLLLSSLLSLLGLLAAYGCYVLLLPARFLLAADPSLSLRQALSQGLARTAGRRLEFVALNLSFLPWHLLSFFLYSAPQLYAWPYSALSSFLFLEQRPQPPQEPPLL